MASTNSYWWDHITREQYLELQEGQPDSMEYDDGRSIGVQVLSDRDDLPVIAIFFFNEEGEDDKQISVAEKLIKDVTDGKVTI